MKLKDLKLDFYDIEAKVLLLFCFLAPLYFDTSKYFGMSTMRVTQEQFLQVSSVFMLCLLFKNIWVSLFLMLSVFQYAFHDYTGGTYLINVMSGSIIYLVSRKAMNGVLIERIYRILGALCACHLIMMFLQVVNLDILFNSRQPAATKGFFVTHVVGFMGLKAISGMFLACLMPFVFYKNRFVAFLLVIPIAMSECSSAVGAFCVSYLYLVWKSGVKKSILIAISSFLLIGGALYAVKDSSAGMFTDRAYLWKVTIQDSLQNPISGWGLDSFRSITKEKPFMYAKSVDTQKSGHAFLTQDGIVTPDKDIFKENGTADFWDNAHNEYVQLFFEYGIFGCLIAFFFFRDLFRKQKKYDTPHTRVIFSYFLTMLILSFGQFPFHLARIGYIFPIMLAAYEDLTEDKF